MVCNFSRAVWKYIRHLDSCDIKDSSDSSNSKMTLVIVDRNKHVFKTLQELVSSIGNIQDSVGHGSVPCRPFLLNEETENAILNTHHSIKIRFVGAFLAQKQRCIDKSQQSKGGTISNHMPNLVGTLQIFFDQFNRWDHTKQYA